MNKNGHMWIYLFGEKNGEDIKVGHTTESNLFARLRQINADQTTSASYVVLAAVSGTTKDEEAIKRYFSSHRRGDKGSRTEYFEASEEIIGYSNWLRSQWWATTNCEIPLEKMFIADPETWLPNEERKIIPPSPDPGLLVQPYEDLEGDLAGTAWNWMVSSRAQIQDYFTPPEIVNASREAMGGLDLDLASHYLANKVHQIPDYFWTGRSAFENDWYGRDWLNPPYGDNAPWFERIVKYTNSGQLEQLCMLSPMWAFQTKIARPVLELSKALILLVPTPTFWGNKAGRTGTNQPHGIIYIGNRTQQFIEAFRPFGMPVQIVPSEENPLLETSPDDENPD